MRAGIKAKETTKGQVTFKKYTYFPWIYPLYAQLERPIPKNIKPSAIKANML